MKRSLEGGVCQYCRSGQLCLNGFCRNTCGSDADCEVDEACIECLCQIPTPNDTICGNITTPDVIAFTRACRTTPCVLTNRYAFQTVDFSGLLINQVNSGSTSAFEGETVYCCQEGKGCDAGQSGCEPLCTSCCDVDDCEWLIPCSYTDIYACVDDICSQHRVLVSMLYRGNDDWSRIRDWSNIDFSSGAITATFLKSQRLDDFEYDLHTRCQMEEGKSDNDFPCMVQLLSVTAAENCVDDCE